MVHRAADSRLLSNLLQHEKEYTKQLLSLLATSNASLTSLAAYAAASPQPLSDVIMAVAGSLAAADDAVRRYAHSIELWRETMTRLKDMEDEVGNIIRDREILVTRLIKASKSSKPGSAITGTSARSSSSLSLSNNQESPASRPLSLAFSTSSKLSAAQSELQACEQHLAAKERELANSRSAALREGFGARLKALVDCGWAWGELGKEGLRSIEALQFDSIAGDPVQNPKGGDTDSLVAKASSESGVSSISPSQSASQINHDHHDEGPPVFQPFRPSELLSAPPLTAEFSTNTIRPLSMATTNTVTSTGTHSGSGTSTPAHAALLAATASTLTYAPAVAVHIPPSSPPSALGVASASGNETEIIGRSEIHLPIPPPHALGAEYVNIPLAEVVISRLRGESRSNSSLSAKPNGQGDGPYEPRGVMRLVEKGIFKEKSVLEGGNTMDHAGDVKGGYMREETSQTVVLKMGKSGPDQKASAVTEKEGNTGDEGHDSKVTQDPESSSDEVRVLEQLEIVENPRFMTEKQRQEAEEKKKLTKGKERESTPLGSTQLPQTQSGIRAAANDRIAKASFPSPSKTFFGSLRGFFGSKDKPSPAQSTSRSKQKSRANLTDSSDSDSSFNDDDWRSPTAKKRRKLKTLLFRPQDKKTAGTGAKSELGRGSLDSWNGSALFAGRPPARGKSRAIESSGTTHDDNESWAATVDAVKGAGTTMGSVKAGSVDRLELGATAKQENHKRSRASSDVGTSIAGGSHSHSLQGQRLQTAKRLKKNRTVTGVERNGSGSDLEVGSRGGEPTKVVSGLGGPPVSGSAAIAKATWVSGYPTNQDHEKPLVEGQSNSKRSNSVDIGVASRRKERRESYVLIDHPDKRVVHGTEESLGSPSTPSSSKGQIVDLGERRAQERERGREEVVTTGGKYDKPRDYATQRPVVTGPGKVPSRSASLSSPRKATTVLTVHSNEEGSAVPSDQRLSSNTSPRVRVGNDIGKTKRTDTLGQSSFCATGMGTTTPSRPVGPPGSSAPTKNLPASRSTPKATSEKGVESTKMTTAAPESATLMNIVKDVKRIGEGVQIASTSKSGTMVEVVRAPLRTTREDLENSRSVGGGKDEDKVAGSTLFQVQAPGSVFDHKHQTSRGKAGSKGSSATSSPSASALGAQQRQGGQIIKGPLKSALKNTSRTPSPSPLVVSASLPLVASASLSKGSTTIRLAPPLLITGQGLADAETASAYESGEEEFFTDEGDSNGEPVIANGHVEVEDGPQTVRTPLPSSNETPRKRKSVRVSLKPTFSPSPPAIEYDEDFDRHRFQKPDPPNSAKQKQVSSHIEGSRNERWEDSSDEDEEYRNAKLALSRAERKDKEVSLSVFGH